MQERGAESRKWIKAIIKEFREHQNPPVTAEIDVVWVLSGPGLYDPDDASSLNESANQQEQERINFGIELVKQITALRLGRDKSQITKENIASTGPVFIYNGTIVQNENLRQISQTQTFPIPQEKLLITEIAKDMDPEKANTQSQFTKFPQNLLTTSRKIAAVSHLHHLTRILGYQNAPRTLEQQPAWVQTDMLLFAVDKPRNQLPDGAKSVTERALKIRRATINEAEKIPTYIKKGDLNFEPKR